MSIKVGNAPVSWGVMEVAGWGEQIPYGKVLDEIAEAGYAGTELGPYGYFPTEPNKLTVGIISTRAATRRELRARSAGSPQTPRRGLSGSNEGRTTAGANWCALDRAG